MAALVMDHTSIQHATSPNGGCFAAARSWSFTLANCPLSSGGYIHSRSWFHLFSEFLVKGWEVQPCGEYWAPRIFARPLKILWCPMHPLSINHSFGCTSGSLTYLRTIPIQLPRPKQKNIHRANTKRGPDPKSHRSFRSITISAGKMWTKEKVGDNRRTSFARASAIVCLDAWAQVSTISSPSSL